MTISFWNRLRLSFSIRKCCAPKKKQGRGQLLGRVLLHQGYYKRIFHTSCKRKVRNYKWQMNCPWLRIKLRRFLLLTTWQCYNDVSSWEMMIYSLKSGYVTLHRTMKQGLNKVVRMMEYMYDELLSNRVSMWVGD